MNFQLPQNNLHIIILVIFTNFNVHIKILGHVFLIYLIAVTTTNEGSCIKFSIFFTHKQTYYPPYIKFYPRHPIVLIIFFCRSDMLTDTTFIVKDSSTLLQNVVTDTLKQKHK